MKDVLKELAEKLPAELVDDFFEWEDGSRLDLDVDGELVMLCSNGTALENSKGTTVLKQYIESEGYCMKVWIIKDRCKIDIYPTEGFKYRIVASVDGFGDNKFTEAVAKAALEVAERREK